MDRHGSCWWMGTGLWNSTSRLISNAVTVHGTDTASIVMCRLCREHTGWQCCSKERVSLVQALRIRSEFQWRGMDVWGETGHWYAGTSDDNIGEPEMQYVSAYPVPDNDWFNIVYTLSNKSRKAMKGTIKVVWEREFKLESNPTDRVIKGEQDWWLWMARWTGKLYCWHSGRSTFLKG